MSASHRKDSHYENHPRAAELQQAAEHAPVVAELHGKSGHLSGPEQTRDASEHTPHANGRTSAPTVGHGIAAFGHAEIAALAHQLWQARGCPEGSSDEDWFRAAEELRSKAHTG